MLIGLNKDEGCTVVINHTDTSKTHSVVISNFDNERLYIREFHSPTSDNSDYAVQPKASPKLLINLLEKLSPDERTDVFSEFCTHCGDKNPYCQCWNDE